MMVIQFCGEDLPRGRVIRRAVHGQDDRVRTFARGQAQRHTGMGAAGASLVAGGRDDRTFARITPPADNDRLAGEFRPPQDLDSRDELIEVEVEDPGRHVLIIAACGGSVRCLASVFHPRERAVDGHEKLPGDGHEAARRRS
jgi:hypothetical protein